LLNETLFTSLAEAKQELEIWKEDYNNHRPHSSIGYLTPNEFAQQIKKYQWTNWPRKAIKSKPRTLQKTWRKLRAQVSSLSEIDAEGWGVARAQISQVAAQLCTGDSDDQKAENYLIWSDHVVADPADVDNAPIENVWIYTENERHVKVRFGSIHGAKGQTHLATLLLSTYNYDHSSVKMIDWLCGRRSNGAGEGIRVLNHMKQSYVAMTRPTHLLGVAVRESALFAGSNEREVTIAVLREKGWQISDLC